ncbi:BglG family transcription antiterminator [Streptococcus suis]|uniref:BglG family transcription antiterminator n=1 Tax=Streptococcus suis TaxID=1307 RepID=UPI00040CA1D8|nr:BglG family transcription antiterminator [Streptococcus suis]MBS8080337.1 HTH domain-containing protein [Streptococcus suis]MCK3972827.1 HTH domain-containing protein [Streptococcus suis]NQK39924.1 HTH domain-containing protein [Streptococcus suis]NQM12248.1 HTH domain-containing protein [Streptococcus suis]NQM45708.1 HTH domain-containing protein [Streptococcus suis]
MLLTKREEQLMKAFLQVGKLSLKEMADILQVSSRTVYRTLSDLTDFLIEHEIDLVKDGKKYYLSGDLSALEDYKTLDSYSPSQRLELMIYQLLTSQEVITNEQFQEQFLVSNVTVIQDIAVIEKRLSDFDLCLVRHKGYGIEGTNSQKRRLLAILLANAIAIQDFWQDNYDNYPSLDKEVVEESRRAFESHQTVLGDIDSKLKQLLIILLSLADNQGELDHRVGVSKEALDFSQKVFMRLAQASKRFYSIQEIIFFASILDELIIKRQEVPLFRESFDSSFYYNISQLIDSVSRFTKIDFIKDRLLFPLLFNHIRLSLAVPMLFPDHATTNVAYLATQKNPFLHRLVSLVIQDIFPTYLHNEYEYELVTLHFASSLRRSPDIYPIRLLLVTDERPLTTSVLVSKIKNIAPFVEWIDVQSTTNLSQLNLEHYDYCLTTKPVGQDGLDLISTFPNTQEILDLQETLQAIQENRTVLIREDIKEENHCDLQAYLKASSQVLQSFRLIHLGQQTSFDEAVVATVGELDHVADRAYLADKLLTRFAVSPLAIPQTNLALIHTQSSQVRHSQFVIVELENSVSALSMNNQQEAVQRILVMLTPLGVEAEVRELMTAISQSIIENKLYTEIYRTGNQEIIYQLLNSIFTETIKKLEK